MPEENQREKMSLVNIRDGAVVEVFDNCLAEVLDNMSDPNTSEKARQITLTLNLKPLEDRTVFVAEFFVKTKLQNHDAVKFAGDLKLDANKGRSYAVERIPKTKQQDLPFRPKVVDFEKQE